MQFHSIFPKNILEKQFRTINSRLNNAMEETVNAYKETAQKTFLQRKLSSPKTPSLIFDSFKTDIKTHAGNTIKGYIICGNFGRDGAYYARYVNDGWYRPSDGASFAGHKFMETAREETSKNVSNIINKHLNFGKINIGV